MASQPITGEALRERAGCVCVAVAGVSMLQIARETNERFIEFRLDSLPDPTAVLGELHDYLGAHPSVTAIATCRRTLSGGAFAGTAHQQVHILCQAARAGCALVDIEVETAEDLGPNTLDQLRAAGAAVILSWHHFAGTPDLAAVHASMRTFVPDFYKIVPTATSLRDSLRLLDLLEQHGGRGSLIAMSMGFKGVLTRVLGPRYGSVFTFASADRHEGTAPGQISARDMRDLYRIDTITPNTALYGVAGQPITVSKSP